MTDFYPSDEQAQVLRQLNAFSTENYRRQRWIVIDRARKLGLTWAQIGEQLGTVDAGAIRMHRDQRPADLPKPDPEA